MSSLIETGLKFMWEKSPWKDRVTILRWFDGIWNLQVIDT